jgi:hypothetical protein
MHPEIAKTLVAQRHEELSRSAADSLRGPSRRFPRWRVSWSRTILSPGGGPAAAGAEQPAVSGRGGSSLVIIISAYRSA